MAEDLGEKLVLRPGMCKEYLDTLRISEDGENY